MALDDSPEMAAWRTIDGDCRRVLGHGLDEVTEEDLLALHAHVREHPDLIAAWRRCSIAARAQLDQQVAAERDRRRK